MTAGQQDSSFAQKSAELLGLSMAQHGSAAHSFAQLGLFIVRFIAAALLQLSALRELPAFENLGCYVEPLGTLLIQATFGVI